MTRTKHDAQKGYYTTIATKISHSDKAKLVAVADRFGMTFYELLQALLLATVRYFDSESVITDEHAAMMHAFEDSIFSTRGSFSPLSIKGHEARTISRALLFVEQKPGERPQLLAVSRAPGGKLTESYNFDTMLCGFMEAVDPEALRALQKEQGKQGYFSIAHTLHEVAMRLTESPADTIANEIAEMFTDARTSAGEEINEDVFYKRKMRQWEHSGIPTPHAKRHIVEL